MCQPSSRSPRGAPHVPPSETASPHLDSCSPFLPSRRRLCSPRHSTGSVLRACALSIGTRFRPHLCRGCNSEGVSLRRGHSGSHQMRRMLSAASVETQLYLLNTVTLVKHRLQVIANYIHRILLTQPCSSSHREIGDMC